ncbi:MAG: hypothetical protein WD825_05695 [Gemmatimonadaceae bacterium]
MNTKLAELRREVQRELRPFTRPFTGPRRVPAARATSRRTTLPVVLFAILKVAAVVALPFVVYVRASVLLYVQGAPSWLAVSGAAILTMALAAGYAAWLSRRFSGRARARTISHWVALPIAAAWCAYAALYLARVNAKSDQVRAYYAAVHPVLRVALATAILADPDIVVTDLQRTPEDYGRMGLPVNNRTKHYRQPNGWVHAVDLRTRERGEIRNRMVQLYFWTMGFQTLRHVGTADHLHVQLALKP